MNNSIREYLDTLFVDPLASVDLQIIIAGVRRWQQQHGFVALTAGVIEIELGDRIGVRKDNGRSIKIVQGYSITDTAGARQAAAAEAAEAERRAEAEAEQQRTDAEQRRAEAEAEQRDEAEQVAALKELAHQYCVSPFRDYLEYAPGAMIPLAELAAKYGQTANEIEQLITRWPGARYLADGSLQDHQWCPIMLDDAGQLRKSWDCDKHGKRMPIRSGDTQYAFDDPRAQTDPVTASMAARRRRWLDRPRTPVGIV